MRDGALGLGVFPGLQPASEGAQLSTSELNGPAATIGESLGHAALAVIKTGPRGVTQSHLTAGTRPVSVAERTAAYFLRARIGGAARRDSLGLVVQSPLHNVIELVPGRVTYTLVVVPLSGPDLFTGEYTNLTDAPHAIMAGLFDGRDPSIGGCLAAGVVNLGTRERFVTDGADNWLDYVGTEPGDMVPPVANLSRVCVAGRDQHLAEALAEFGLTVSTNVPSAGVRVLQVASGQSGATFGWAANGGTMEAFVGVALARLAGCTTLNLAGSEELGLITLADMLAHGADYVIAGNPELAKQLTEAIQVQA